MSGTRWRAQSGWLVVLAGPPAVTAGLWPDLVIRHPVLAAGIGFAYGTCAVIVRFAAGVMSDLVARWEQRAADGLDRALQHRVSGFGCKYRAHLQKDVRFIEQKGLATVGPIAPELDEVFVDVSLAPRPPHLVPTDVLADSPADVGERRALQDFLDARKPARLAVIGAPGSGKTTLLRNTTRQACAQLRTGRGRRGLQAQVPILLYLRHHTAVIAANPDVTLADLLRSTLHELRAAEPDRWFEQRLIDGECLVLLDGLDEVARQKDRASVAAWAERQMNQYPANDFGCSSFRGRAVRLRACTGLASCRGRAAGVRGRGGSASSRRSRRC